MADIPAMPLDATLSSPPSPRGWYQDPGDPNRDRWWDGAAWTTFTHRSATLRRSLYGPQYARLFWAGPNRAAGRALLVGRIAMVLFLVVFVGVLTIVKETGSFAVPLAVFVLVALAAELVLGVFGVVNGVLGIRAASQKGALVVAIWGLVLCGIVLSVFVAALIVVIVARTH